MSQSKLAAMVAAILADGIVDADEVVELKTEFFDDGVIDEDELRALGQINEGATEKCPEFTAFYTEVLCSYALEDDATPGVVDAEEAAVIIDVIGNDGEVDEVEQTALTALADRAVSMDPLLTEYIAANT